MRFIVLVIVISSLSSCRSKEIPRDIIPITKMHKLMWDMMRADQFVADYLVAKDTAKKKHLESARYYSVVFKNYGVTREDFQKSFDYYRSKPALFQTLMDSVANHTSAYRMAINDSATVQQGMKQRDTLTTASQHHLPDTTKISIKRLH